VTKWKGDILSYKEFLRNRIAKEKERADASANPKPAPVPAKKSAVVTKKTTKGK